MAQAVRAERERIIETCECEVDRITNMSPDDRPLEIEVLLALAEALRREPVEKEAN